MYLKTIKFCSAACGAMLLAVLAVFGILFLQKEDTTVPVKAGAVSYNNVSENVYLGLSTDLCKECGNTAYLIDSEEALASVFRYGNSEGRLTRCYVVTFSKSIDIDTWGIPSGMPQLGQTESTAYGGHFDFNHIQITFSNTGNGFFPYLKNASLRNMNAIQRVGNTNGLCYQMIGSKIQNVQFQVTYTTSEALSDMGGIVYYVDAGSIVSNCSVVSTLPATYKSYGGIARTCEGTITACSFLSSQGDDVFNLFGGIVYSLNGTNAVVSNCNVTLAGGTKTITDIYNGGIVGIATNAVISYCTANIDIKAASGTAYGAGICGGALGNTVAISYCTSYGETLAGRGSAGILTNFLSSGEMRIDRCEVYIQQIGTGGYSGGIAAMNRNVAGKLIITDSIVNTKIVGGAYNGGIVGGNHTADMEIRGVTAYLDMDVSSGGAISGLFSHTRVATALADSCRIYLYSAVSRGYPVASLTLGNNNSNCIYRITNTTYTVREGNDIIVGKPAQFDESTCTEITADELPAVRPTYERSQLPPIVSSCSGAGGEIQVRLIFQEALRDYGIRNLYISVIGNGADRYTQLIAEGKVVGLYDETHGYGDGGILCGEEMEIRYVAVSETLAQVAIKIELEKGGVTKSYVVMAVAGHVIQLK